MGIDFLYSLDEQHKVYHQEVDQTPLTESFTALKDAINGRQEKTVVKERQEEFMAQLRDVTNPLALKLIIEDLCNFANKMEHKSRQSSGYKCDSSKYTR